MKRSSEALGRKIRYVRECLELSQAEFAKKIGLSGGHSPISRYENGQVKPDHRTLEKIAALASKSPAWLLDPQNDTKDLAGFTYMCKRYTEDEIAFCEEYPNDEASYLMMVAIMLQEIYQSATMQDGMIQVMDGEAEGISVKDLYNCYRRLLGGEDFQTVRDYFGLFVELRITQHQVVRLDDKLDRLTALVETLTKQ